jgi:SAM-dependent methyltransferase
MLRDEESQAVLPANFRGEKFQLVCCSECGLTYLPERPNKRDISLYYSSEYCCFQGYEERGIVMHGLARTLACLKYRQIRSLMLRTSPVLLDYGCGSGTWIRMLREFSPPWRIIGTDIVEEPIHKLAEDGFEAYVCDDSSVSNCLEDGQVGLIHLFHVIEHVPSPRRLLGKLFELLAPGGFLIGQTPNVDCWERRLWKDNWTQWHVPRHFTLFDGLTLRRHAERAGFKVLSLESSLSSATQWALSLLKQRALRRERLFRLTHEPWYPPLILLFLPLTVLQILGRCNTSHIDFVMQKPHFRSQASF